MSDPDRQHERSTLILEVEFNIGDQVNGNGLAADQPDAIGGDITDPDIPAFVDGRGNGLTRIEANGRPSLLTGDLGRAGGQ